MQDEALRVGLHPWVGPGRGLAPDDVPHLRQGNPRRNPGHQLVQVHEDDPAPPVLLNFLL